MLWLALAAQLSAPVLTTPNVITGDDVPQYLIDRKDGFWFVDIRVTVTPGNAVQDCQIEKSSGIRDLDVLTCSKFVNGAKFKSAMAADGTTAFGVYRTSVMWAISGAPWDTSKVSDPDLDLSVQRMPNGARSPALVHLMFSVDAAGQMSGCTAEQMPLLPLDEPALVPVACDHPAHTLPCRSDDR